MRFSQKLAGAVKRNQSLVCIGLDSNSQKIPAHLKGSDRIFQFNKALIDATADLVCAYKPNSAFYEGEGARGVEQLKRTCDYLRQKYPKIPLIFDAKRGDIGSTNEGYAKFAFEYLEVDAITVSPYLGREAMEVFLSYKQKGIIVLCKTSNPGAAEIQDLKSGGQKLYQLIAKKVKNEWNGNKNCLLVVGATYPKELADIRRLMGNDFIFLVPGVGAQGGDVKALGSGLNRRREGLIISSSREIIFASAGKDFAEAARQKTLELRDNISKVREK